MQNNKNDRNNSSKPNFHSNEQTSPKNSTDSITNKANRSKAVPDKRERRDGPGGENQPQSN